MRTALAPRPLILLGLSLLAYGCSKAEGQRPSQSPGTAPPETVAHAVREEVPHTRELSATVRAVDHVQVAAESTGRMLRIHVNVGDRVQRGQLLAEIESSALGWARDAAKAQMELASQEAIRVERLHESHVTSDREVDLSRTLLTQAHAKLRSAELAVSHSRVRAPSYGVVEARLVSPGDLAVPGTPLFSIYDGGRLWLEAHVPAQDAQHVSLNTEVQYRIGETAGTAPIAEVEPRSDPRSRTVRVRIALQETDFAPGAFGTLGYAVGTRERISVPQGAVAEVGQMHLIVVHEADGWHRRAVRVGTEDGDRVEILAGLAGGEEVGLR